MLIRVNSDLHCEFWTYNKFEKQLDAVIPPMEEDKQSILVLAGDVGLFYKYDSTIKPALSLLAKRFKHVLYVFGNHEFYNSCLLGQNKDILSHRSVPKNVHLLDDDYFILDDVLFIGATLWTSFNNRNPLSMYNGESKMNDFRCIKKSISDTPYGRSINISAEDTVDYFDKSLSFIKSALTMDQFRNMGKVVITHHSPSLQSIHERYRGDLLNDAFSTDLSGFIIDYAPDVWIHGHTHDSYDYIIGKTNIICNPFGYHAVDVNKGYNSRLLIDLELKNASVNSEEVS